MHFEDFGGGKDMKVLLLGEFSGFYTNLKDGLQELLHTVSVMAGRQAGILHAG